MGDSAVLVAKVSPRWGRRLPQRGRLGQDGAMRDLNDLTRPTVPSGAIQERMLAETEERRGVVGPAPALLDDAGAPAALRICHLAAGNQSPDPLIDFPTA